MTCAADAMYRVPTKSLRLFTGYRVIFHTLCYP